MDPLTLGLSLASSLGGGGGSTKVNTTQSSSNVSAANISSAFSNIFGQAGDTSSGGLSSSQTATARSVTDSMVTPNTDLYRPTIGGAVTGTNLVTGKTLGLVVAVAAVGGLVWYLIGKRR